MQHKNPDYFVLIESFIDEYQIANGLIPTNIEISRGTNLSTATVSRYIAKMCEEGILVADGHRNIKTRRMLKNVSPMIKIPIIGNIACGTPILAESNIECLYEVPLSLLDSNNYFLLRAKGFSMINVGIQDGDLILIRSQTTAEAGQIVVALIDDEATLKRYYPEPSNNRIRLHPENEEMDDIYVETCNIQGIALKIIKDIR